MAKDNPFSDNPFNKSEVAHTLPTVCKNVQMPAGRTVADSSCGQAPGLCIVVCNGLTMKMLA